MPGTTVASLRILLGLDSGGVKTGANSVNRDLKSVQQEAAATNAMLMQVGKGLQAGLGLGAGLGAFQLASRGAMELTQFLTDGVRAAQDDEASVARLTQALHENVAAWDGRTDAIDAAIATGQRLGFTDDEVRDSLVRLSAATHDVNEAIHIHNVAMDLAHFKDVDLATATSALTKIEAGRFRGLADLGIVLQKGATQVEALAAVEKVAAGQAKIFGETSAGAAEEAGVAMNEAQESIGRGLVPVFKELSHFSRDVVAPALTFVGDNMGTITAAGEALAVVLTVRAIPGLVATAQSLAATTFAAASSAVAQTQLAAASSLAGASAVSAAPAFGTLALAETSVAAAATTAGAAEVAAAGQTELFSAAALTGAPQLELFAAAEFHAAEGAVAVGTAAGAAAAGGVGALLRMLGQLAVLGLGPNLANQAANEIMPDNLRRFREAAGLIDTTTASIGDFSIAANTARENAGALGSAAVEAARNVTDAQLRVARATVEASAAHADLAAAQTAAASAADGDADSIVALAVAQAEDKRASDALKAAQEALTTVIVTGQSEAKHLAEEMLGLHHQLTDVEIAANLADAALSKVLRSRGEVPRLIGDLPLGTTTGDPGAGIIATLQAQQSAADAAAARERERLAQLKILQDQATADGKRRVEELAAAYSDRLGGALDTIRANVHRLFDELHQRNLDAIRDIHDTANAALDEQERAIRGSVDAERARVEAIRTHRQEIDLRANVTEAANPEDLARAQQALNDFLEDQRIRFLDSQADNQVAALDAQKAANDKLAAAATQAEDDRNAAQVAAFDFDLAALQKGLAEHPKAWASTQQDILKLLMAYGVDYRKAAESLGKQFADGLLATTRQAEDAARAVAEAANGPLGIKTGAGLGTGTTGSQVTTLSAADQVIHVTVNVGDEQLMDYIERRLAANQGIYDPTPVSTGSLR